jgi:polar amino acid transport system substrate-binding protein
VKEVVMKKFLVISIVMSFVFIMSGFTQAQQVSTLETVKKQGFINAGVKFDSPPFGYLDKGGNVVGFDIDIVKLIAKNIGVDVKFTQVTAKTRVPLLQNGTVDLVAASFSHYIERDEIVDFSISYLIAIPSLLVRKGSRIRGAEDLAGKYCGVVQGTPAGDILLKKQPKVKIKVFQEYPIAVLALKEKKVDAVITDDLILYGFAKTNPDLEVVGRFPENLSEMGIAVRENDSKWRDAINFGLISIWEDGSYQKIFKEHFGTKPLKEFYIPSWKP